MTEERLPLDDLGELAAEEMSDKYRDGESEAQTHELYDLPSEPDIALKDQQRPDRRGQAPGTCEVGSAGA